MAVLTAPAAPLIPALPQAAGPSCTLQRVAPQGAPGKSASLWQLGIEARELTTAIGLLAEQLETDDDDARSQVLAELEAALLAEEGNKAALAAKADATCWVIEHLRGQAAYRQQQAKRLAELSRYDACRADALEESLVQVLTWLQPSATRFSFPSHELRSTRSTAVAIENEALLDPEWLAVKTTFQADKAALKAGQQITGVQLLSRRSSDCTQADATTPPASDSAPAAHQAHPSGFSPEQLAALSAPLDRANVRQREQGRSRVSYLEGWQRQTIAVRCVAQAERLIGARGTSRDQKPGWGVTYTARVRVTVTAGGPVPLVREGSGAGHGIDVDLGQAHESALKEAETDAMKRALMTFGNPFGLALYDKRQREVTNSAAQERPALQPRQAQPAAQHQARASTPAEPSAQAAAPASQQDPGLLPLDAATVTRPSSWR